MSDGTFGTFQGYPLRACIFRHARGYVPGGAEMTLHVSDFPAGFEFTTPAPGELATPKTPNLVSTTREGPAPLAKRLDYEGFLVMSEEVGGQAWKHPPVRLFVVSVSTARVSEGSNVALVRIVALDSRYHWDHGWLRRWSYNRVRADGTLALDSCQPDGTPFARRWIAYHVCRALFRRPTLAAWPAEWDADHRAVDFGPNPSTVSALARLTVESLLEEPCWRLDETVALHRAGDGNVGWAPDGKGANVRDFPPELLPSKDGTGQGHTVELAYVEDVVLVAGGPRIASVAIDDLEPVVIVDGVVFVLNEANVRELTGGRYGLEWLRRWVFAPPEFAGAANLPEPIAAIFREQAFRLWRIPGVEIEKDSDDGGKVREPGQNAHLVPLLARAETVAGRRLPITLETYTFAVRHRTLRGSGATATQIAALQELSRLRNEIIAAARTSGRNPFSGLRQTGNELRGTEEVALGSALKPEAVRQLLNAGVSLSDLQSMVDYARTVARISDDAGAGFAGAYENALSARFAAEDEGNGTGSTVLFELAKKFLDAEKKANEKGSIGDSTTEAFQSLGLDELLLQEVKAAARELQRRREEREKRAAAGGAEGDENGTQTFFENVARIEDAGARAYDLERGILESSGLAGHLADPAIHDLAHPKAELLLRPVRVIFGAHLRPRVDVPPGLAARRVRTGSRVPGDLGGQNVIPEALGDEESYFLAAFKRGPGGAAVAIPIAAVPDDQALVVPRPDLVELVPIEGEGNKLALEQQAVQIASDLFRQRAIVKAAKRVIARPWPVQCDGVVSSVTITLRQKDGAPCGWETEIVSGGDPAPSGPGGTQGNIHPPFRSGGGAAAREGLRT